MNGIYHFTDSVEGWRLSSTAHGVCRFVSESGAHRGMSHRAYNESLRARDLVWMAEGKTHWSDLIEQGWSLERVLKRFTEGDMCDGKKTMNAATVPVQEAEAYVRKECETFSKRFDSLFPDFVRNYTLLQTLYRGARDIPRYEMPVIEPEDVNDFQKRLAQGDLDLFQPFTFGHPEFPKSFPGPQGESAGEWVNLGQKDGDPNDDKVPARITTTPSGQCKPTQNQVWFDKVVCYLIAFGRPGGSSPVLNKTVILSKEGYLLDGHHRVAQAVLADPSLSVKSLVVPLDLDFLLTLGKSYSAAIGRSGRW